MATTIENRARSYAYGCQLYGDKTERILGYEAGARDEQAIDIEKAISILKQTGYFAYLSEEEGSSEDVFVEQFKQSMVQ